VAGICIFVAASWNKGTPAALAIRLCRDAVPNVQSVLACFSKNRSKISGRCNAVLASYGF
jgi:hypothetical protein